jgi:hypothetical protein
LQLVTKMFHVKFVVRLWLFSVHNFTCVAPVALSLYGKIMQFTDLTKFVTTPEFPNTAISGINIALNLVVDNDVLVSLLISLTTLRTYRT